MLIHELVFTTFHGQPFWVLTATELVALPYQSGAAADLDDGALLAYILYASVNYEKECDEAAF